MALCRTAKLSHDDMDMMTIGMCLDYVDEYNGLHYSNPKKGKVRRATQADIEALKGR